MAPSSRRVTVSNPACGCGSPTVRSPMSRWSSINKMNGSLRANSSGDTTRAARCPGPTNPGASGGTVTTRAIRRCGFMMTSVDTDSRFGLVLRIRKSQTAHPSSAIRSELATAAFALFSLVRKTAEDYKQCKHKKNRWRSWRLPATHVIANCQQHDGCKPHSGPCAEPRSDADRHGQDDAEASDNLSGANEGCEAPCDADRSLLLGLGFELFVGKQLQRTDSDEGECQ